MKKKCPKSIYNPYGIMDVSDNIILDKPSIICVMPSNQNTMELNGYLNKIMYLLQIRHLNVTDSNYDISTIPFNLLIRTHNDDIAHQLLNSIPSNNVNVAKKIIRNINLISYCAGHSNTSEIIHNLYKGLIEKGYSKSETEEILKEIFVLQIVDNYIVNHAYTTIPYATTIVVHNIYDSENINQIEKTKDFTDNFSCIRIYNQSPSSLTILYKAFGEESLAMIEREHEFTADYINAPILNAIMGTILINALSLSLNNREMNLNVLLNGIENILAKSLNYLNIKGKAVSLYTKEDINELNEYIMQEIQDYFHKSIEITKLSEKDKERLNRRDRQISEYIKLNKNNYLLYSITELQRAIDSIIYYYNNYSRDDEIELSNSQYINQKGQKIKIEDLIIQKINDLVRMLNGIIKYFDQFKIPENLDSDFLSEYNNLLLTKLESYKEIINKPELEEIIREYKIDNFPKL